MDWIKKHTDSVMVIGAIISSMLWMNGKFNHLETELAVMRTVLIMKQIMPIDLAAQTLEKGGEL